MSSFDPYAQYLDVQFGTSDQGSLILMTYDGAIRFCRSAEQCMTKGDKVGKGEWLSRAFDTVAELRKSLKPDLGGELAEHLNRAYTFIGHQITLANLFDRPEHIHNAVMVLEQMRDSWREIITQQRRAPVPSEV